VQPVPSRPFQWTNDRGVGPCVWLAVRCLVAAVAATTLALAALPTSTIADPTCTDTWTGGAGTEVWQTATNWSTSSVPGSGDVACIGTGVTVQVTGDTNQAGSLRDEGSLAISGGSLELTSSSEASSAAALTLSGGTLTGSGELDVSGSFSWTGGSMTGTGKTVLEAGAAGSINPGSGSSVMLSGRDLMNQGTLTWSTGSVEGRSSAEIDNGGTFEADADASGGEWSERGLLNGDGSDVWLHNTGTVKKVAGSLFTQIQFQMDNEGAVEAKTGQIILTGGNHGGTAEGGSWAGLEGGGMVFNEGSYILGSDVEMSGSVFLTGGSVQAGDIQAPEATLWLWSGGATLTLTGTSTASHLGTFNINSGTTLTGAGTLDIASSFAWGGGTMSGSGQTVLGSAATGSIDPGSGSSVALTERELVNEGTLTWSTGSVEGRDSAEIDNGGTLDMNADASGGEWWEHGLLNSDGSDVWLHNTGTVKKVAGSLFTQIQFQMDNEGAVEAKTGQIILTGGNHGSTVEEGSWAGVEGGGMVFNSGSYILGSDVEMSGSVFLTGGSVQAGDIQAPEATLWLWSGSATLTLTSSSTVSHLGTFNIESGTTLTGAGTLDIASSFAWAGDGSMSGAGSTVLGSGASGAVEAASGCESMSMAGRTFVNEGTLTFGSGTLLLAEGARFDNQGTFKDNSEASCYGPQIKPSGSGGTAPSLLNTGTFEKTAGGGTSTVAVNFGNDGHVEAQTGELDFADGGIPEEIATGSWSVRSGASIVLSSGTFVIAEEVDLSAADISGATVEREPVSGPPRGYLNPQPYASHTVTLSGYGRSVGTGFSSASLELAPTGTEEWRSLCGPLTPNLAGDFSCSWNTASGYYPDGSYKLRAQLSDSSEPPSTAPTATVAVLVDNTSPTGSVSAFSDLHGAQTVSGTASDTGSGISSWQLQIAPEGSSSWTDACPVQDTPISGSTYQCTVEGFSYTDGVYQLRALITDNAGNTYTTTPVSTTIDNTAPSNTSPPDVSGAVWTGKKLTASTGLWAGTGPLAYTYQWQLCNSSGASCSDISGATSSSYTVTNGDIGSTLRVVVTATNDLSSAMSTSEATAAAIESTCTDSWTGDAGDGLWQTAGNWSTGSVPGAEDQACIGLGETVQLTSGSYRVGSVEDEGTLKIIGGSLELGDASTVSHLWGFELQDGTLSGAGSLEVSSWFYWGDFSAMTGSGQTVLGSGVSGTAYFGIYGPNTLNERTLVNEGTLEWYPGTLYGENGAVVENKGTFNDVSDGTIFAASGSSPSVFENAGTFNKTSGAGTATVGFAFDNSGTVEAQTGQLAFSGGSVSGKSATGSWIARAEASIAFQSGSFSFGAGVELSGYIDITEADVSAGDLQGSGATLKVTGGSLDLTDASTASHLAGFELQTATLSGAGSLEVSSWFYWGVAGSMTGSGQTVLGSGVSGTAYFGIYGSNTLNERTLVNEGTLEWYPGNLNGSGLIENTGTVIANGGSNTSIVEVRFTNQGTVGAHSGTIDFTGGGIGEQVATGAWHEQDDASIVMGGGTFYVEEGVEFETRLAGATIIWVPSGLRGLLGPLPYASGTVTVAGDGEGSIAGALASASVEIAAKGSSEWKALCASLSPGLGGEFSCSWNTESGSYPDGEYQLRGSLSTSSSPPATALTPTIMVLTDNTAPSGSLTAPSHSVGGSPTITGTASDSGSGVRSWQLQIASEGSSEWTSACPEQASPISSTTYGCAVNATTHADGTYELRALITDMAGNAYTTSTVGLHIDNTTPSGSLASVSTYLGNTVELSGTASGSVASWAVQTALAGTSSWSNACSASSPTSGSEYRCNLDTTTLADGEYELRAVITDDEGNTYTTASRSTTIDNTPPGGALYALSAKVSGDVEVDGYAYDTGSGVASWKLQIAPAGSETYEEACPSESLLVSGIVYGCTLETGHLTSGTYHLRAVIVDNAGNTYTTSVMSTTVESAAPTSSSAPTISGEAVNGRTLSASTGDWSGDAPITYHYQWRRCNSSGESCVNIEGATSATYVLAGADVGSTLRIVVTASNTAGEASATSSTSAVVAAGTLANVSAPVIGGSTRVGATLGADPGKWRGSSPISYAYQWQRCNGSGEECADIEGATKPGYTPLAGDLSKTLRVKVTATNSEGSASATSAASPQVVEGAGSGIRYLYDEAGRLDLVDDPTQGAAVYRWDADGNLLSVQRYSASALAVLQLTPAHAPPGTQVDITGTGFSAEASNDEVSFDGTTATVSKATTTDLIVTVPEGASAGTITVKIGEHSAESPGAFTPFARTGQRPRGDSQQSPIVAQPALPAPSIVSMVPASPASGKHASKPTSRRARRCRSHTSLKMCVRPSGRTSSRKRATSRRCAHRRRGVGHGAPHARCAAIVHHKAKHATTKHAAESKTHKPQAVNASSQTATATAASTQAAAEPPSQAVPASLSPYRSPYTASWRPEAKNRRDGDWITARHASPWTKLPQLRAPHAVTALSGQALEIDGIPLANVTLSIQGTGKHTKTDSSGRFLLTGLSAGHQVLVIEGQTADGHGQRYGRFTVGVDLVKGETNPLGYTIWMTPLEAAGDSTIPSQLKHEAVLTNPSIPGFEVRLPAGTTVRSANGAVVHHLNLTAIPIDRPPFPLPLFVSGVPTYFTVQPGGAYLNKGARIIYPNWGHLPPGQRVDFWNYDPSDRGWYIYGKGSVSRDGKQVVPDPGVRVWEFTGAMISGTGGPPSIGSAPGSPTGGDPVDLGTGLFVYSHNDLQLPDSLMPVTLTRTYRPGDDNSYSFGIGTQSPFDIHLWSNENYKAAYLIEPDGGKVKLERTSSGTGYVEAVYAAVETSGPWEGATMVWDGTHSQWILRRRDGTKFIFGEVAPLQAIEDRNGNRITLVRSGGANGPISEILGPHGRSIYLSYDSDDRITRAVDSAGQSVQYAYDSAGRLVKVTDPMGDLTRYAYDSANDMTSVTDARGNVLIANTYDEDNHVRKQTLATKGTYSFSSLPTCAGCEAKGITATAVTDPDGHKRDLYFTHGLLTTEIQDPGSSEQWTTYTRDTAGNPTRIASSAGDVSYTYDSVGNVTSIKRESPTLAPLTTSYTYNEFSEPLSVTNPLGQTTSYVYDTNGNLAGLTDPIGRQTTFGYDSEGEPTSVTDPQGDTTTYEYSQGERVGVTNPLGHHTEIVYDDVGRPVGVRDPEGRFTQFTYDPDNDLLSETNPAGDKTSYAYDADGDLTAVTDPRGHTQTGTYDAFDELSSWTDALSRTTNYTYDGIGNLATVTDAKGQTTTYSYNGLGWLSAASFGATEGGPPTSTITYSYDGAGNLSSMVDSRAGTWTMSYDPYHRLTGESGPTGSVGYAYNAAGERQSMSLEGEEAASYSYNPDGQITGISTGHGDVAFTYDHDGRRTQTLLPNGDSENYSYDAASQLASIDYKNPASEPIGDLLYGRDALGRVTTIAGTESRTTLPEAMSEASYDFANELTSLEGQTRTYDADGNLTNDGTSSFSWNDRNQLTGVTQGTNTWSYAYDPLGRRIDKTANSVETKYLYAGKNVAREASEGNTAELLNGLHLDERFARTTSAGTDSYLTDELNSTLGLAGESGAPTTEYTYGPFGVTTATGATSTNPYQYTGRENDNNGLQYNRARYYTPSIGRFVTQDPLGMAGSGINLYGYVGDSPMNAIDPSGMVAAPGPHRGEEFGPGPGGVGTGPGPGGGGGAGAGPGGTGTGAGPGGGGCGPTHSAGGRGLWGKLQCTNYGPLERVEEEVRRENEEEEIATEEEERREVVKRCVGGVAIGGVDSWVAKTEFTPVTAITGCAAGIYGPVLVSGIKSVLE
jgi:RHS repeat-associated protein